MAMFCGIVVLFLERSLGKEHPDDRVEYYLPAGLGCAVGNYFGNSGHSFVAIMAIGITIVYVILVLKPFVRSR